VETIGAGMDLVSCQLPEVLGVVGADGRDADGLDTGSRTPSLFCRTNHDRTLAFYDCPEPRFYDCPEPQ